MCAEDHRKSVIIKEIGLRVFLRFISTTLERTGADALLPIRMAIYNPPPNREDCPRYERCAGPKVPARQTGLTPQAERDTLEPDG